MAGFRCHQASRCTTLRCMLRAQAPLSKAAAKADDDRPAAVAKMAVSRAKETAVEDDDAESFTLFVKNLAWKTGAQQTHVCNHVVLPATNMHN